MFQIIGTIAWCGLMSPAILIIFDQKVIHPQFTDVFTLSDVFYLMDEIFTVPGQYYAWVLSPTGFDWLATLISVLLFAPFFIWPFLESARYRLLKTMLCAATIIFIVLCLSASTYIFLV
jgi:hypothetical protein